MSSMSGGLQIVLDAMGSDHAPAVEIEGAVQAAPQTAAEILLVGRRTALESELARWGGLRPGLSLVEAAQVVGMGEEPVAAVRAKPDSSLMVGLNLVSKGEAQAFVSMGNTGAVMAGALFRLGRLPGVSRPALSIIYPGLKGPSVVLDVGANADCRPEHLLQFGLMGAIYAERVLGITNPRVALLSNGEEPSKGTALVREAHELLTGSNLNFIGNVEGVDIPRTAADVVVCDGFSGNIVLKLSEGVATTVVQILREELKRSPLTMLGAFLARPALRRAATKMNYAEFGGALLLGVKGIVIIGHGRSNARAVRNALLYAERAVRGGVREAIQEGIGELRAERSN